MDSLADEVLEKLNQLDALRESFLIRAESLPADLALAGLYSEVRETAFLAVELCRLHTPVGAFPLARTVFEATQRLIVLATDGEYVRVGTRAMLYYLRKDMRIVRFARDGHAAREWYERATSELLTIWSAHNPAAERIIREEDSRLDVFQRTRRADNFMGDDLAEIVERRYSILTGASGRSMRELKEMNRGIYTALSRESYARLRLDPAALRISPDGTVNVIPRPVDEVAKSKLVLGCLDSSLAEARGALAHLVKSRRLVHDEAVQRIANNLTHGPLPRNFKPDLGLNLLRRGGASTTFHFSNVPIQKVGIQPDGTITWSSNIVLEEQDEYVATFDVPPALVPELARVLRVDVRVLRPSTQGKRHALDQKMALSVECTPGDIQKSEVDSFVPLTVIKVAASPPMV